MYWLEKIVRKNEKTVIGLMSGTSMDGVDAALVSINGYGRDTTVRLVDFLCVPYDEHISGELRKLNSTFSIEKLSGLNFLIGETFASAAEQLMDRNGLDSSGIDLIGSHGQTVFHNPPSSGNTSGSTIQIGEADVISERTGITTVSDFRTRDMASGGQGAPLIPYIDYILFFDREYESIAQNIGGIANLTLVTPDVEDIIAFDTGPGNSLIDIVFGLHTGWNVKYDNSGTTAASGKVDHELLERLMSNEYFSYPPPKSTGREVFGTEMAEALYEAVRRNALSFEDLISTLTQFTVDSICFSYEKFIFPRHDVGEIIMSGGGARNNEIMRRMRDRLADIKITVIDQYGIPAEAKEAVGFAILANETVNGNSTNLPSVTGAVNSSPIGKISIGKGAGN